MIASVVTPQFGLLASDSAMYDTKQSRMSFQSMKLFFTKNYLITFIGTPLYFAKIDRTKLEGDMPSVCLYLEDYLKEMRPKVDKAMKSEIADPDENKPNFCLFLLGVTKKLPTLAQFNSYLSFKPKFLFSEDKPKFATIFYGDDNPEKKKLFTETTAYMEKKLHKWTKKFGSKPEGNDFTVNTDPLTPGVLGEILTRGIYKKADLEQEMGHKLKYAGGVVNVAGMDKAGAIFALSGLTQG